MNYSEIDTVIKKIGASKFNRVIKENIYGDVYQIIIENPEYRYLLPVTIDNRYLITGKDHDLIIFDKKCYPASDTPMNNPPKGKIIAQKYKKTFDVMEKRLKNTQKIEIIPEYLLITTNCTNLFGTNSDIEMIFEGEVLGFYVFIKIKYHLGTYNEITKGWRYKRTTTNPVIINDTVTVLENISKRHVDMFMNLIEILDKRYRSGSRL